MMSGKLPIIERLRKDFRSAADPANAVFQKAYMRDQFDFFGLKTETRREITKNCFREMPFDNYEALEPAVKELWQFPQREYQYAGQELLVHHKKLWTKNTVKLIEYCIVHKSWWDTVDYLNSYGSGHYFQKYPEAREKISATWNRSDNIWLNRSSLLFQLKYKDKTDTQLLAKYILHLAGSKEFFIQKAIGWVLREYSKTDPVWVRDFIRSNRLATLSAKEGSKYI